MRRRGRNRQVFTSAGSVHRHGRTRLRMRREDLPKRLRSGESRHRSQARRRVLRAMKANAMPGPGTVRELTES